MLLGEGATVNVFLSFSGSISHQTAQVLEWWLPKVIQQLVPFLSSEDIDKGTRWGGELAEVLDTYSFGIICVNRQNVSAPWINFETGALSKSVKKSRVAPFLLGLDKAEIRPNTPLVLFQATSYDKQDVKRLLNTFNNAIEGGKLAPDALDEAFDMWWPRLQERLDPLEQQAKQLTEPQPQPVGVTNDELLKEILELAREQGRLLRSPGTLFTVNVRNSGLSSPERAVVRDLDKHFAEFRHLFGATHFEGSTGLAFKGALKLLAEDLQGLTRLVMYPDSITSPPVDPLIDETRWDAHHVERERAEIEGDMLEAHLEQTSDLSDDTTANDRNTKDFPL